MIFKTFLVLASIFLQTAETKEGVSCRQSFFKKLEKGFGISEEKLLDTHVAFSWFDCVFLCLESEKVCVLFSYLAKKENNTNCRLYGKDLEEDSNLGQDLEKSFDDGEDLVAHVDGIKDEWEIYKKFVDTKSRLCVNQGVCLNGATCVTDSCESEGYRCVCDKKYYGQRCENELNDFDLVFPGQTAEGDDESYIMVKDAVQSNFKEFTFSTWIKTSFGLKRYRLFTYTLGENSLIELGLKIRTSPGENSPLVHTFVLNGSDPSKNILSQTTSFQPINDNVWHHVALTWSEDGEWMTFVDGKLLTIRNHSSLEIPGGGVIYIGKAPGKSVFKDDDGFVGELSRLNFWNHMLSGEKIEQMALSSNNDSGNIIRWSKLLDSTFGKVKMIKPSTAVNSEKELDFQIHFPVSNSSLRSSFISWPVTKALDSLAVCFWIKIILSTSNNTDDFTFISHHSDAGDKDYFEYGVHLQNEYRLFAGINGTKIRSSEKGETGTNGEWHFNCMSWNGKSGDVVFFHDGIPLGHKRTDGSLRAVLPSVGNISFGSKWKYNGSLRVNELTYGKIAYLNVWSYTLPERAVLLMSAGGLNINGDVMAWKHVQKWIVGYLPVVNRTVIYFPGYSVLKRRTEWCYSHVNNVNAACGSLYARLGNNRIWKSMQWRCYCENVLVCSKFTYKMEVKYKHLSVNVDDKFMYSHHRDLIRIN